MTIGIIGFGSIGERHYNNIRAVYPKFKINILTKRKDITPHKNTMIFHSEKEFFNQPNNVFFITNETDKHAAMIIKCLSKKPAGIFVEKPVAHNMNQITKITELVRNNKPVFMIGYCLQFHKPLLLVKKMIEKKVIGDIIFIRVSIGQDLRTWRKIDYRQNYSYNSSRGGGVILDLIHDINYPAWLIGEKIFFVKGWAAKTGLFDLRSEDMSEGIFRSESGKIIFIHQDYLQIPGRRYCEIAGTKGTIIWDDLEDVVKVLSTDKKIKKIPARQARNNIYVDEIKSFFKNVSNNNGKNNINEAVSDLKNALMLKKHVQ